MVHRRNPLLSYNKRFYNLAAIACLSLAILGFSSTSWSAPPPGHQQEQPKVNRHHKPKRPHHWNRYRKTGQKQPKLGIFITAGEATQKLTSDLYATSKVDDVAFSIGTTLYFNPFFALEFAYEDYGTETDSSLDTTDELSTTALTAGFLSLIPVFHNIHLQAKIGLAAWDFDDLYTNSSNTSSAFSDEGFDFYYGLGVTFRVQRELELFVEYTTINADPTLQGEDYDLDLDRAALGLKYLFH